MAIRTEKWDTADFLNTEEDVAAYLDAALEENDVAFFVKALGNVARSHGMTKIAKATGRSRESLYKALHVDGNPEFATIMKVMKALGLKMTIKPYVANVEECETKAQGGASHSIMEMMKSLNEKLSTRSDVVEKVRVGVRASLEADRLEPFPQCLPFNLALFESQEIGNLWKDTLGNMKECEKQSLDGLISHLCEGNRLRPFLEAKICGSVGETISQPADPQQNSPTYIMR